MSQAQSTLTRLKQKLGLEKQASAAMPSAPQSASLSLPKPSTSSVMLSPETLADVTGSVAQRFARVNWERSARPEVTGAPATTPLADDFVLLSVAARFERVNWERSPTPPRPEAASFSQNEVSSTDSLNVDDFFANVTW